MNDSKSYYHDMWTDSFWFFFRKAWEIIEPETKLDVSWHMKVVCNELQDMCQRVIRKEPKEFDLIFNVPPGSTKSSIMSICFPVWAWIQEPSLRIITMSYSEPLALAFAVKSRDIILSEWFQDEWGDVFKLKYDSNKKSEYTNDKTGMRLAIGAGTSPIGRHGDIQLCDDAISPEKANSITEIEKVNRWWDTSIATRVRSITVSARVILMQRLMRNDLTGHCLAKVGSRYKQFCFPSELTEDVKPEKYRAKYIDGLLEPVRFGLAALAQMKVALGSAGYAGQFLQSPVPDTGNLIKIEWIGRYHLNKLKEEAYENFDDLVWNFCVDGAYTSNELNAPTAIFAYAFYNGDCYVRDVGRVWMELPELIKFIPDFVRRNEYSEDSAIYIEPKASGMSAAQMLRKETPLNVILDKAPRGDKVSRFKSKLPFIESGRMKVLEGANWVIPYLDELKHFPHTKYKDQVDVTVMAIDRGEEYTESNTVLGIRAV